MKVKRQRIDNLLVSRGLAPSRARAQAMLMAGEVSVNGRASLKAGSLVAEDAEIIVRTAESYVGRGGLKLEHALDAFACDVTGKVAVDVGASTGGFTDCLLRRGASRVYAVDVGYGQLDYRLRRDDRVVVMERINARYPLDLPEPMDLATMDVSFISVTKVLPSVAAVLKPGGVAVILLKPQFEALREEVGKGGVVRDVMVRARVIGRFVNWLTRNGWTLGGLTASPITGATGNREFLLLLRRDGELPSVDKMEGD